MNRDEHRALAEQQIEESDRLFADYQQSGTADHDGILYSRISHLRQSAAVHAMLAGLPEPRDVQYTYTAGQSA